MVNGIVRHCVVKKRRMNSAKKFTAFFHHCALHNMASTLRLMRRSFIDLTNAENSTMLNLLQEEKDFMREFSRSMKQKLQANAFLGVWADEEHDDLKDICNHLKTMMDSLQELVVEFNAGYEKYRGNLKEIQKDTYNISKLKQQNKRLVAKAANAKKAKKSPAEFELQASNLQIEIEQREATCESDKRLLLKEGLNHQFDAMIRLGKQMQVIGTFGKHMTGQIPQGKLTPGQRLPEFKGSKITQQIHSDFTKELTTVGGKAGKAKQETVLPAIPRHPSSSTSRSSPFLKPLERDVYETLQRKSTSDSMLSQATESNSAKLMYMQAQLPSPSISPSMDAQSHALTTLGEVPPGLVIHTRKGSVCDSIASYPNSLWSNGSPEARNASIVRRKSNLQHSASPDALCCDPEHPTVRCGICESIVPISDVRLHLNSCTMR